jgi:hypothetical protein
MLKSIIVVGGGLLLIWVLLNSFLLGDFGISPDVFIGFGVVVIIVIIILIGLVVLGHISHK